MQKILALSLITLALTGCIRKVAIEQGNVMTPEMTTQLHSGMSQNDVRNIIGSPMLINTFNDNRIDYVYTYKPGNGVMTEKMMTLTFENGVLKNMTNNMPLPGKS